MNGFYQPVIRLLKARGYRFIRNCKGSHEFWAVVDDQKRMRAYAIVPRNLGSRDTANGILKNAGIKDKV